jgi:hypothetical protein
MLDRRRKAWGKYLTRRKTFRPTVADPLAGEHAPSSNGVADSNISRA